MTTTKRDALLQAAATIAAGILGNPENYLIPAWKQAAARDAFDIAVMIEARLQDMIKSEQPTHA